MGGYTQKLMVLLLCCPFLQAQEWSKEDSIKLSKLLSGKDSIKLNPEFQRAIIEGTFINTNPIGKFKEATPSIPFTKDFSEYIKLDPSVLNETIGKFDKIPSQAALREPSALPKMKNKTNGFIFEVPKSSLQGAKKPSGIDFNHLISYLLSPEYRRHIKNQRRLAKLKNYNNYYISDEESRKRNAYRAAHPEMFQQNDSNRVINKTQIASQSASE